MNKILVTPTRPFETVNEPAQDAFLVVSGMALVFIEQERKGEKRRTSCIAQVSEGQMIPGFSFPRREEQWGFLVVPQGEMLQLERYPGFATRRLQQGFLGQCGVPAAAGVSFEESMTEILHAQALMESITIIQTQKGGQLLKAGTADQIRRAFEGDTMPTLGVDAQKDPVYKAVAYACHSAKIPLAPQEKLDRIRTKKLTVMDIAKASGFLCRDVVLEKEWYHNDCGVIISDLDGVPVACIPKTSGRYYLYRSDTGEKELLDQKTAAEINPKAFSIGRALPKGKVSKKDMVSFAVKSVLPGDIIWVVLLGVVGVLIGMLLPTLNQQVFDEYIPVAQTSPLFSLCMLILTFTIGNLFFSMTKSLSEHRISSRVSYDLQNAIYYRLFSMPESFFRKHSSADLAERMMGFGSLAGPFVNAVVVTGVSTLFSMIYLFQMIGYSGKLTGISLLMVLLYVVAVFLISLFSMKLNASIMEEDGNATGMLYQFLSGVDKIRMAGCEQRVIYEYMVPYSSVQAKGIRKNRIDSVGQTLGGVISSIFSMVLYYLIVNKKLEISIGTFMAFNSAFGALSSALLSFASTAIQLYASKPMIKRISPILEEATEGSRTEGESTIPGDITGAVSVNDVSFAYDKDGPMVLHHINLEIKAGEYIGIVGPSGCGKSTLMKLLLGFETPDNGSVCFDGFDMASTDKREIRKQLGVVLQNGGLISGSIHENITITNPKATMRQVREVIRKVGLKEDIDAMPMGVHTIVSESASMLSGGQQQRILIARAIMNNPKVLLFDEATSALDNVTQKMVCDNLDAMNITRIVIAHRLSTIEHCDRIIFLNRGRIEEQGTFEQLMANRGMFYQMAIRQLHGDEEEEYE